MRATPAIEYRWIVNYFPSEFDVINILQTIMILLMLSFSRTPRDATSLSYLKKASTPIYLLRCHDETRL